MFSERFAEACKEPKKTDERFARVRRGLIKQGIDVPNGLDNDEIVLNLIDKKGSLKAWDLSDVFEAMDLARQEERKKHNKKEVIE